MQDINVSMFGKNQSSYDFSNFHSFTNETNETRPTDDVNNTYTTTKIDASISSLQTPFDISNAVFK